MGFVVELADTEVGKICGLDIGRDLNAARNILRVGMDSSIRRNSNSDAQLL
jgi:transposase